MRLAVIILLAALTGCCPKLAPPGAVTQTATTWEPFPIFVPGATVRDTLPGCVDSLPAIAPSPIVSSVDTPGRGGAIGPVVTRIDTAGRARLSYWRDAYRRLVVECTALDQIREAQVPRTTTTTTITQRVEVPTTPGWVRPVVWSLAVVCAALLFIIIIRR